MHVILLHESAINPIRIPLFNAIAAQLNKKGITFKVFWLKERLKNKYWKTDTSLISHQYVVLRKPFLVLQTLHNEKPDIIIGSYGFIGSYVGLLYSQLFRKKFILWSGSWLLATKHRNDFFEILKKFFVKRCHSYIAYGSKAAEYLKYLGADNRKIFIGCNVSDTKFYIKRVAAIRSSGDFQLSRNKYAKVLFLFIGQLIVRKGIINMLDAFSQLTDNRRWQLLIAGDGPLKSHIKSFVSDLDIAERVKILGFLDREDLVKYYALADVFILPSLFEPFGLVLSEAISSGLYVVASKYAGGAYDLIKENINGNIIDPFNINQITDMLKTVIENFDSLPSREAIKNSISHLTIENYAIKICEAIYYTTNK